MRAASNGAQVPWENTSLEGDFFFRAPAPSPTASASRALPQVVFAKPSAAAPRRAEIPSLAPGDRWTYKRVDVPPAEQKDFRLEVEVVEGGEIRGTKGDRFDREWALLSAREGLTWEPQAKRFVWPMSLGAMTKTEYRVTGSQDYPQWTVSATVRVVGLERVTVPAGAFDTFRVEVSGEYRQVRSNGRSGSGTFKNTYWYSPEVKKEVLRELETVKWDGTIESRGRFVLIDYSVR